MSVDGGEIEGVGLRRIQRVRNDALIGELIAKREQGQWKCCEYAEDDEWLSMYAG